MSNHIDGINKKDFIEAVMAMGKYRWGSACRLGTRNWQNISTRKPASGVVVSSTHGMFWYLQSTRSVTRDECPRPLACPYHQGESTDIQQQDIDTGEMKEIKDLGYRRYSAMSQNSIRTLCTVETI